MKSECFDHMSEYKSPSHDQEGGGGFLKLKNAYDKARETWRAKAIEPGSVVWVPEQGGWWPGRVLNRYDREEARPVPDEVWKDEGSKDRFSTISTNV